MTRTEATVGALLVAAFGVVIATVGTGFPAASLLQPNGDIPDVLRDWLSVSAIFGDGDPSDSLTELARVHLGVDAASNYAHPRTPGALLMLLPLVLLPAQWVWTAMVAVVIGSVAMVAWLAARISGLSWWWIPVIGCALMVSPPVMAGMLLGSQMPLVAVLLGVSWLSVRRGDDWCGGVWLGVAATLKLFPGLLILMLMWKRPRAAFGAAGTVACLNLAGLLLPDVSVFGQWETLISAPVVADHNLSLGLPIWVVPLTAAGLVWMSKRLSTETVMAVGSVAMLILSPMVWNHYLIVLAVPAVWAVHLLQRTRQAHTVSVQGTATASEHLEPGHLDSGSDETPPEPVNDVGGVRTRGERFS